MPRKAAADMAVGRVVMSTAGSAEFSIPEVVVFAIVKKGDACQLSRTVPQCRKVLIYLLALPLETGGASVRDNRTRCRKVRATRLAG